MGEMFRHLPWPFPGGEFPAGLGAVVQRTVLSGEWPALLVVHDRDGDWMVGDGVHDPNGSGACVATHLAHAIAVNSSIAGLADLPPGWQATRDAPATPWRRSPHTYPP